MGVTSIMLQNSVALVDFASNRTLDSMVDVHLLKQSPVNVDGRVHPDGYSTECTHSCTVASFSCPSPAIVANRTVCAAHET